MKIETWLRQAKKQVDSLDAELIAVWNFAPHGSDRSWLVAHDYEEIEPENLFNAWKMVQKRSSGMPLAYVLGEKEFYGRSFCVNPAVLIPRPETEGIINLVKTLDLGTWPQFLEIGTGSGCVAITLALEFPQSNVIATDISVRALDTASLNDSLLEGRVEFVHANLLRDLDLRYLHEQHYDVMVANLPYVNKAWDWVDTSLLSYEPANALYARSSNGLSIYKRFFKEIVYQRDQSLLWIDYLAIEADPCQHEELKEIAAKAEFQYLRTEGYCLLFEDEWRYWWDWRENKYVHKPADVIKEERRTGIISWSADAYDADDYNWRKN